MYSRSEKQIKMIENIIKDRARKMIGKESKQK